jgi:two-component system, OmpR family, response regulator AdeR
MPELSRPLVLIAEDELHIARVLEAYLRRESYRTDWAADGETALLLHRANRPDLVLLDIHLPKLSGYEVFQRVRQEHNTPIIFVTALAEDVERLTGLRLGADDYIVKPFSPPEVVARVAAVLRRARHPLDPSATIRLGGLEIDSDAMRATAEGQELALTLTEFRLLEHLAKHPNRVLNKSALMAACLPESDALERVVEVHVGNLRRKLEAAGVTDLIQTVRGVGFRLWLR